MNTPIPKADRFENCITVNGFSVDASVPAFDRNGWYRGIDFRIDHSTGTLSFQVNTTYPIDYDEEAGVLGLDQSTEIELEEATEQLHRLLQDHAGGCDNTLAKKLKGIDGYVKPRRRKR